MTELKFDRALYAGVCVDEAVKVFANYAAFELVEEPQSWVVKVSAANPGRERKVCAEFGNFALGLTIKGRGKQ